MKKLLLPILALTILSSCNKEKELSSKILEDIQDDDLHYVPSANGPILKDEASYTELRLTNRVFEDSKALTWEYASAPGGIRYEPTLFYLPKEMTDYEFVKETEFEDTLSVVVPYSEEFYNAQSYHLKRSFRTYESFKNMILENVNKKPLKEQDTSRSLVRLHDPVKAKTHIYKVITTNGEETVHINLYQINGMWKVGSIIKQNI